MASSTTDTEANFKALLKELGLTSIQKRFEDNGWMSLQDFAFAPADKDKFESEVVPVLLKLDVIEEKKLLPRVRRLWNKAYAAANTVMSAELLPQRRRRGCTSPAPTEQTASINSRRS